MFNRLSFTPLPAQTSDPIWRCVRFTAPAVAAAGRMVWRTLAGGESTRCEGQFLWRMIWCSNRALSRLPRLQPEKKVSDVGLGLRMELDLSRLTDSLAYVFGAGENDIEAFFRRVAGDQPVVLDVGANIGTTSLIFSRLRPRATIYAFEPSHHMRAALTRNITLNRLTNILVVPLALGNENVPANLQADHSHNPGSAFVTRLAGDTPRESIDVVRLDDWLPHHVRVDFMKLDVEGYELRALQGAEQTLRRSWPDLIFELNQIALKRAGTSCDELLAWVRSLGYRTCQITGGRLERFRPLAGLQNVGAIHPLRHGSLMPNGV